MKTSKSIYPVEKHKSNKYKIQKYPKGKITLAYGRQPPRYPPWSPLSPDLSLTTMSNRITWTVLCDFHAWDIKGMVASAWSSLELLAKEEAGCHDTKMCQQPVQQLMRGGDGASS